MQYSENNLNTFHRRLAQAANTKIIKKPFYSTLQVSEGRFPNFHLVPKFNAENGKDIIEGIRQKGKKGYPTIMKTHPLTTDTTTFEQLDKYASVKGNWAAMSMKINQLKTSPIIEYLSIKRISKFDEIKDWCTIVEAGLLQGNSISHKMIFELSKQLNTFFYLAYYKNQPVATALTILEKEEIGIYLIATLEQFRRKGIGQAITTTALLDTSKHGGNIIHLQATKLGEPVYKRIGFQKMMDIAVYKI